MRSISWVLPHTSQGRNHIWGNYILEEHSWWCWMVMKSTAWDWEKSNSIHFMFITNLDYFRRASNFQVLWTETKQTNTTTKSGRTKKVHKILIHLHKHSSELWGDIWISSEVHIEKPTGYPPRNKKHCMICRKNIYIKKCSEYSWSQFGNVAEMSMTVLSRESEWSDAALA